MGCCLGWGMRGFRGLEGSDYAIYLLLIALD